MKFVMLLSFLGLLMCKASELPIHIDHKKTGEIYINHTKYNMLTPVYHITEDGPKTGIRLHNVATRKVFVDDNGVRHSWINIKDYKLSRKSHKRQKPKLNEEKGLVEANGIEKATNVVELAETATEQTDANPDETAGVEADQNDETTDVIETATEQTDDNPDVTGVAEANENEETTDVIETATEQTEDNPDENGVAEADENEEPTDVIETATEQTDDNPDETGAAEADENEETTDVIETATEQTDDNPDESHPKLRQLRADTTKATTKATTKKAVKTTKKPTTTPPLQKLTYVKTTFFCPFLGVFTTNHYNYEIVKEEKTDTATTVADATTKKNR